MTGITRTRLALAAAILCGPALPGLAGVVNAATPVCNQAGPWVFCSDGTSYHTFGNTTTDNRGNVWLHDREMTVGSDGRIILRPPGQAYDPSPLAWPPIGNGPLGHANHGLGGKL